MKTNHTISKIRSLGSVHVMSADFAEIGLAHGPTLRSAYIDDEKLYLMKPAPAYAMVKSLALPLMMATFFMILLLLLFFERDSTIVKNSAAVLICLMAMHAIFELIFHLRRKISIKKHMEKLRIEEQIAVFSLQSIQQLKLAKRSGLALSIRIIFIFPAGSFELKILMPQWRSLQLLLPKSLITAVGKN